MASLRKREIFIFVSGFLVIFSQAKSTAHRNSGAHGFWQTLMIAMENRRRIASALGFPLFLPFSFFLLSFFLCFLLTFKSGFSWKREKEENSGKRWNMD